MSPPSIEFLGRTLAVLDTSPRTQDAHSLFATLTRPTRSRHPYSSLWRIEARSGAMGLLPISHCVAPAADTRDGRINLALAMVVVALAVTHVSATAAGCTA